MAGLETDAREQSRRCRNEALAGARGERGVPGTQEPPMALWGRALA